MGKIINMDRCRINYAFSQAKIYRVSYSRELTFNSLKNVKMAKNCEHPISDRTCFSSQTTCMSVLRKLVMLTGYNSRRPKNFALKLCEHILNMFSKILWKEKILHF